ncbi:TMV resistance protein N-like [Lycium ferocissimum]|uniref:TMV resistance protein N-like n=1 Tax=Lycium ferocissimum TaxID=112874 RepID=UPI0028151203|nr:TMV resistance protein N-like [Lycium ferocissimum]
MASSSSSASNSQDRRRWKHDVFLSCMIEDTETRFTRSLVSGLKNRGIFTFRYARLEHGDSVLQELSRAIEGSQLALIILSTKYAESSRCFKELEKIMECKDKSGLTVLPVYYHVNPSDVRNQSGRFGDAFAEHVLRYKDQGMQMVQGWRTALTAVANLKGWHIRDGDESEIIRQIVNDIASKICKCTCSFSLLDVGLEKVSPYLR